MQRITRARKSKTKACAIGKAKACRFTRDEEMKDDLGAQSNVEDNELTFESSSSPLKSAEVVLVLSKENVQRVSADEGNETGIKSQCLISPGESCI